MNTIKNTSVILLLTSTFALAGGDFTTPVEPVIDIPVEETKSVTGPYVGLSYSCMETATNAPAVEIMSSGISALAGYTFHKNFAVEGRYTASLGDAEVEFRKNVDEDRSWDMSNIALYLKPQYQVGPVNIYGLVGYGQTTLDTGTSYTVDGFQYGAGLSADVVENVQVFVDYRRLYDDTDFDGFAVGQDVTSVSWSLGANYKF